MADTSTWKLLDSYFVFKEHTGISALAKQAVAVVVVALLYYYFISDSTFTNHRQILSTTINDEYDYVIVGGGSAGSVLAARLSEDGMSKVLVLEAGGFYDENPLFHVPMYWPHLINTKHDWGYYTEAQTESCLSLNGQKSYWPRGKVLGGSSCLNALLYTRGSSFDYDKWASNGCTGWSYKDVLPYFLKSEDIKIDELKSSLYHHSGGLLSVAEGGITQLSELYLKAGEELNYTITDYNGADQLGFSKTQITSLKGVKGSTGLVFLGRLGKRANLDIVIETTATKIDIKDRKAIGVFYMRKGKQSYVKARKEVILSAGSINSPQLLMLSGVGPKSHLKSLDIPSIVDLPVGENLQDHLSLFLTSRINKPISLTDNRINSMWSRFQYKLFGKGPHSTSGAEGTAFFCTKKNGTGKEPANIQLTFHSRYPNKNIYNFKDSVAKEYLADNGNREGINFILSLIKPKSKGTLRLRSRDPIEHPAINPQYLIDIRDVEDFIAGIRIWERFVQTRTFAELGVDINEMQMSFCAQHEFRSNEYWECFIRNLAVTLYNPTSTCKMGGDDDPTAVVDSKLRVKGVEGLRVVDASVLLDITSGNTNAPVIMVAEKASDIIRDIDSVKHLKHHL